MADQLSPRGQLAFTTHVFTSNMEALDDMSHYPSYCRRGGKDTKSNPILRARKIFDQGTKMPPGKECTNCLRLGQDCIRYDSKFSKCCWCTAEDFHPVGLCHLPGVAPPTNLSMTANAKKRKLELMVDSDKRPTTPKYGQSQFRIESPRKAVKMTSEYRPLETVADSEVGEPNLLTKPCRTETPSPAPIPEPVDSYKAAARFGSVHLSGCEANSERIAALEATHLSLDQKFNKMLRKIDELVSSVRPVHGASKGTADDRTTEGTRTNIKEMQDSPMESEKMTTNDLIAEEPCDSEMTVGTPTLEEAEKIPEHTLAHPMGFPPSSCICAQKHKL